MHFQGAGVNSLGHADQGKAGPDRRHGREGLPYGERGCRQDREISVGEGPVDLDLANESAFERDARQGS